MVMILMFFSSTALSTCPAWERRSVHDLYSVAETAGVFVAWVVSYIIELQQTEQFITRHQLPQPPSEPKSSLWSKEARTPHNIEERNVREMCLMFFTGGLFVQCCLFPISDTGLSIITRTAQCFYSLCLYSIFWYDETGFIQPRAGGLSTLSQLRQRWERRGSL